MGEPASVEAGQSFKATWNREAYWEDIKKLKEQPQLRFTSSDYDCYFCCKDQPNIVFNIYGNSYHRCYVYTALKRLGNGEVQSIYNGIINVSESLKKGRSQKLKEGMETVRADLESIEKFLNENGRSIWWDVYDYSTAPMGTSRIDFQVEGDWKHDHWAFKDLIQEWADKNGRKIFKIDSQEVGESDSDDYTAIYSVYIAKDEESFNTLNSLSALFAEDFDGNFTGLDLEG